MLPWQGSTTGGVQCPGLESSHELPSSAPYVERQRSAVLYSCCKLRPGLPLSAAIAGCAMLVQRRTFQYQKVEPSVKGLFEVAAGDILYKRQERAVRRIEGAAVVKDDIGLSPPFTL